MITIYLTDKCNLNCDYCHVNKNNNLIQDNDILNFLKFLKKRRIYPFGTPKRIDLVGGEPLLFPEKVVFIKNQVNKTFPELIKIGLITNLTLWDTSCVHIYSDPMFDLGVSLDGTQKSHDFHRKFKDGRGSFSTVFLNLAKLTKLRKKITLIYTYDPNSRPNLRQFINKIISINNSKCVDWTLNVRPISLKECIPMSGNEKEWFKDYIDLIKYCLSLNKKGYSFVVHGLATNYKLFLKFKKKQNLPSCGIGYSSLVLTPDGNIWPCDGASYNKLFCLGKISKNTDEELFKRLLSLRLKVLLNKKRLGQIKCDCVLNEVCDKFRCMVFTKLTGMICPIPPSKELPFWWIGISKEIKDKRGLLNLIRKEEEV